MIKEVIADKMFLDHLRAYVADAEAKDPVLARKGARFARALHKRQQREFLKIKANPDSKLYRDYMVADDPRYGAIKGVV